MFTFAVAADFRDGAPHRQRLQLMMERDLARASDGCVVAQAPHAAASVARWAVVARDRRAAPAWDDARGLLFAGDVRLYNRSELIGELDGGAASLDRCADLELARLAYVKWGPAAPGHLVGDFAFVAWDEPRRTLFAARDHFGIRPLHYRLMPDGIVVASDVTQILGLIENPGNEVNHDHVLDWLTRRARDAHWTYFRGVTRVAPGCCLTATAGLVEERRYWAAPDGADEHRSYAENCEELRRLFRRAVRDRLESDYPVIAHSSGGFDSSTILMAAGELYQEHPARPPLVMVSAVAPGFPSDESHYMDAVAARLPFAQVRWNVVGSGPFAFPGVHRAAPAMRSGFAYGPRRDLEVAREQGARVLLSGVLGDGVLHATGVRRDMIRHGWWLRAARDIAAAGIGSGTLHRVAEAALGLLTPPAALAAERWLFRRPTPPPAWLGPALRNIYPGKAARADLGRDTWPSHVLCAAWARRVSAEAALTAASFVEYAAEDGVELRAPYADVRLAEHILRIPWQQREPKGHYRRTGRDALGPLLPPEFNTRIGQQPWTAVHSANALRALRAVATFITTGPWRSADFVDRGVARAMLRQALADGEVAGAGVRRLLVQFAMLEAWLRELFQ